MEKLIKYDYNGIPDATTVINPLTSGQPIMLISNFPATDQDLSAWVATIGHAIVEARNNEGGEIFDVQVVGHKNTFSSFATSHYAFPLHTDCSDAENPPNCVALLCVRQSTCGGSTLFSLVTDVINQISDDLLATLLVKKFTFRNVSKTIFARQNGQYFIRYNRITIENFSQLTTYDESVLDQFDTLLHNCYYELKLQPNDLILFRNDLVLHGRNEFSPRSDRLLKRIRFNLKENYR